MGDFIGLVAEDVIALFEGLCEKDDIIKRQTVLLERAYNNKYVGIVGKSHVMKEIFDILELVESSESPLLIEGESGTGKELLAAAVHYNSSRRHKMFVIQNCSAFNETLLCSELFGHEKGSFTGAISDKKGLFELADGGTLFLDEIGDMDIGVQAKLLRVLEGGTFYSVGGTVPKRVNVRMIAATNKKLKHQVDRGLFRKDLFYRINTLQITMPPLRERKEDILILADYFAATYAEMHNRDMKVFHNEVLDYFSSYDWPGNIRELKNLVERLIVVSGKDELMELKHLPKEMRPLSSGITVNAGLKKGEKLRFALQIVEKELITKSLKNADWNKTVSSEELGISRSSLNNKIVLLNIVRE